MKSAFIRPNGSIVVREMESRSLKPEEIRVKVEACGICGTDLQENHNAEADRQFGHEVAGIVMETGSAVANVKTGDKIVLDSATPCGCCDNCRNTRQELCTNIQSFFFTNSFGFAEEMIAPGICAIRYEGLTPVQASLQEPLGVAIDLCRLSDLGPTNNVLIIGMGPIGLMAQALARRAGVRKIFVSDTRKRVGRFKTATAIGFDAWLDPEEQPIAEYDFQCPIDRIIVTAPPVVLPNAFKLAAKGAIISFLGIGGAGREMCNFNADDFHFKKLQLRASFASPALFGPMAVQFLREKVIDPDLFISHVCKLDDMAAAMDIARRDPQTVKVVVTP